MLRADSVSLAYGDETVVDDLTLSVDSGEVVAVIGPSGVGKTTLLRLLSLSLEPDSGRVTFDDTDVWAVDEDERLALRRRVGMVFQEASLFDASVARNVEYGLRIRRQWRERFREQLRSVVRLNGTADAVEDALEVVGMTEKIDQDARSLSGGEAQRVSFARALAYDPDVLLLDEPTSDLNPRNTAVIESAIETARNSGIGVVVATHDMNQAERIADRVAVLLDSDLTEVGPAKAVFESPEDERTRKFISGELVY
jgi:tungstate transport system ATP-binding protein